jgi:hypothetical protein
VEGTDGADGADDADGADGTDGTDGTDDADDADDADGADGTDGAFVGTGLALSSDTPDGTAPHAVSAKARNRNHLYIQELLIAKYSSTKSLCPE